MEYIQEITLDINTNTAYTTIGAKQGDNRSRAILAHITNEGQDVTINPNVQPYFRFKKPDGKVVVNGASVENNAIKIVLTAQTLAVAGRGYGDITFQDGNSNMSTVSFIIIIMASPQISKDVQSSDEFGYLNAVVGDATNTIYEAESWAVGTRGSIAVASASSFDITCAPSGEAYITSASAIQSKFMDAVGDAPGLKRVYTFTYVADANWWLECESINGPTVSKSDQELVNNIAENYGITYSPDEIDADNKILVTIEEPDPAYENNAKYYMELSAAAASSAIETLENCVKATPSQGLTDTQKANARANIDAIGEPSEKSVGQFLSYGSNGWVASDGIKDPVEKVAGQFLTYGSDGWAASTIDYIADPSEKLTGQVLAYDGTNWSAATKSALDFNAIPITLTSYFYGNELPGDPVQGRLFFLKSGTEVT